MRLTQNQLLEVIRNCKSLRSNDDIARLLIQKKGEYLIQYLLTMELEKLCEVERLGMDTSVQYLATDYNSKIRQHDIVILEGVKKTPKGRNSKKFHFYPSTAIELKFFKANFVIDKENDPVDIKGEVQDNVWLGNMTMSEDNVGEEKGVIYDINKMYETQHKYEIGTSIHHIMVLSNPHETIDEKFVDIIDGLRDFNKCLLFHNGDYLKVREDAVRVYEKQLNLVQKRIKYGQGLKLGTEVVKIGKGFGVELELIFLVLSEENNIE